MCFATTASLFASPFHGVYPSGNAQGYLNLRENKSKNIALFFTPIQHSTSSIYAPEYWSNHRSAIKCIRVTPCSVNRSGATTTDSADEDVPDDLFPHHQDSVSCHRIGQAWPTPGVVCNGMRASWTSDVSAKHRAESVRCLIFIHSITYQKWNGKGKNITNTPVVLFLCNHPRVRTVYFFSTLRLSYITIQLHWIWVCFHKDFWMIVHIRKVMGY